MVNSLIEQLALDLLTRVHARFDEQKSTISNLRKKFCDLFDRYCDFQSTDMLPVVVTQAAPIFKNWHTIEIRHGNLDLSAEYIADRYKRKVDDVCAKSGLLVLDSGELSVQLLNNLPISDIYHTISAMDEYIAGATAYVDSYESMCRDEAKKYTESQFPYIAKLEGLLQACK